MNSMYEASTLQEFTWRIEQLSPASQRQWGKMTVDQMLAHCCVALETALGDRTIKRGIVGFLFGRMSKSMITNDKPFRQDMPTDKTFIITGARNINEEKQKLLNLLTRFSKEGVEFTKNRVHPFFGKLTPDEWGTLQGKHLDHHLRQFGA